MNTGKILVLSVRRGEIKFSHILGNNAQEIKVLEEFKLSFSIINVRFSSLLKTLFITKYRW